MSKLLVFGCLIIASVSSVALAEPAPQPFEVVELQATPTPSADDFARSSSYTFMPAADAQKMRERNLRLSNDLTMLEVAEANGDQDLIRMAQGRLDQDQRR